MDSGFSEMWSEYLKVWVAAPQVIVFSILKNQNYYVYLRMLQVYIYGVGGMVGANHYKIYIYIDFIYSL